MDIDTRIQMLVKDKATNMTKDQEESKDREHSKGQEKYKKMTADLQLAKRREKELMENM